MYTFFGSCVNENGNMHVFWWLYKKHIHCVVYNWNWYDCDILINSRWMQHFKSFYRGVCGGVESVLFASLQVLVWCSLFTQKPLLHCQGHRCGLWSSSSCCWLWESTALWVSGSCLIWSRTQDFVSTVLSLIIHSKISRLFSYSGSEELMHKTVITSYFPTKTTSYLIGNFLIMSKYIYIYIYIYIYFFFL